MISLGKFSFIFVLLASLVVINAFNYIDGIDGLSISISISAILYFIFLSDQDDQYVKLLLCGCNIFQNCNSISSLKHFS